MATYENAGARGEYTGLGEVLRSETWWELDDEKAGPAMAAHVYELWTLDQDRRIEAERCLRRFNGRTLRGIFQGRELVFDRDNTRLNVTKAITETLTAKVGSNRPRPKVLTDGANHALRVRGKKLQRFLDGTYQQAEVYSALPSYFRDAMLFGTGVMHFFPDFGARRTRCENVFPLEMVVDPVEAVNGDPQTLYRYKIIDKTVLKRMFPDHKADIENAKPVGADQLPDFWTDGRNVRMTVVIEGWCKAGFSLEGKLVPGRHVIAIDSKTLLAEPFEETEFPFEFFHWTAPTRGFWGDSAVGEIRGIEKEINRLLQHIQKSMKLAGMPWVLNPNGAKVKTDKLTNEVGLVVNYDGPTPPSIVPFQAVHPQVMEHLWALYAKAFETLGTNQMQAAAVKPPGIDSGRALEQLGEEHLVRFKHISQHFEDLVGRRFASQFVRCARQLDKWLREEQGESDGYVLRAVGNKTALKLAWKDCAIAQDDFFLQTWPTSVLPVTPSGRTEEVERWIQMGLVDQTHARSLLDFPDLESETDIATADRELVEYQIEKMVDEGEDVVPEPRQDLQYALQRCTYALELGMRDGTPERNLDKLRTFLNACEEITQAAQAAAAANAPPPAMAAPGPTMPMGPMGAPTPAAPPGLGPAVGAA